MCGCAKCRHELAAGAPQAHRLHALAHADLLPPRELARGRSRHLQPLRVLAHGLVLRASGRARRPINGHAPVIGTSARAAGLDTRVAARFAARESPCVHLSHVQPFPLKANSSLLTLQGMPGRGMHLCKSQCTRHCRVWRWDSGTPSPMIPGAPEPCAAPAGRQSPPRALATGAARCPGRPRAARARTRAHSILCQPRHIVSDAAPLPCTERCTTRGKHA